MKRILLILIFLTVLHSQSVLSQQSVRVKYNFYSNGNPAGIPELVMDYSGFTNIAKYVNAGGEEFYIDYNARKTYQTFLLKSGSRVTTIEEFDNYTKPELTGETAVISGYSCRKAVLVIRSNNIELWFTDINGLKGTPSASIGAVNIGNQNGLVLKIVRNGNFEISAGEIEIFKHGEKSPEVKLPLDPGEVMDMPSYKEKVTEDNFTTLKIFTDEKINFGDTINNPPGDAINNPPGDTENITYRYSKGTVILKKIKLPENMQGSVVFAELTESSRGDAYDRTGSVFILPRGKEHGFLKALKDGVEYMPEYKGRDGKVYRGMVALEDSYYPPAELMRFITPFGAGYYNSMVTVKGVNWEDRVVYKQDITEIISALEGEVWVGVFIGCYDKGGHNISLSLKYHPEYPDAEQKNYWLMPVVNTLNVMEASSQEYSTIFGSDTLTAWFDVPEGVKNLTLRYISTGHGGWENGDEFNKKMNEIFLDGARIYRFIPWRDDCGMYRKYNPASGNFPNGVSSSDYSRSGWCPGSTAIPVEIPLRGFPLGELPAGELKAGRHKLQVYIPMGKPEGTSFSAWNVSIVLIGER